MASFRRALFWGAILLFGVYLLAACGDEPKTPSTAPPVATATHMEMTSATPYVVKDDFEYIDLMTVHHRVAVEMARLSPGRARHGEVLGISLDIIKSQEDEIRRLQIWRDTWYPGAPTPDPTINTLARAMPGMSVDLNALAAAPDFDRAFIEAMVPHHSSAIEMSRAAAGSISHPELRDFANDVITYQQMEIDRMLVWKQEWFK